MSRNRQVAPSSPHGWLDPEEQRAWLAYIRVQLRLTYEMNRQLQADSGLSLADYDVLAALSSSPSGRMQITALAAEIGWERSRVSHHVRRMARRGLVDCASMRSDRRVTEVGLSDAGIEAIANAAPGHVEFVKRLFFGGVPRSLLAPLAEALEGAYREILAGGTLPPPPGHPPG
jgi:DNA-binding MarR family transcriptional regulator